MADTDIVVVTAFERVTDDDGVAVDVKCDQGGGDLLVLENFPPLGDDAPPLPGDFVAVKDSTGQGNSQAIGYQDAKNAGVALGGEKRMYARAPDGSVAAVIWLHGDGLIEIEGLASGQAYKIGKVMIDADGNITTPGEITAMAGAAPVKLSTHLHPTGTGPSGAPTPGT